MGIENNIRKRAEICAGSRMGKANFRSKKIRFNKRRGS